MILTTNEKAALLELKNTIKDKYKILDIKIFGSKVKGIADKESDLDILIVADKIDWAIEKDLYGICFEISLKHDVLLSPILFSTADINNKYIKATPFYQNVEREGISIWNKNF